MKRFYWALIMFAFGASGIKANIETPEEKSPKVLSDSIVVTANRFGLTPQNSVWPTTLINHQTLKNHSSLQAVLDGKAGIDVRSYNGDGSLSTLSNWGLFNRHMLLLYNGRAVKDYSLGGFNLSEYSIDEIDRIEILKGPQSAFYGSDAVGGVVNLITNNSMVDRLDLTTKQGSFNLKHYHLNMTKKINQFSLGGYAEFSETDNHRNNAGTTRYLLKLQTNYFSSDGRHYVSLSTRYFNDSLGVPGPEPDNNFIPVYGNEESYSLYDHQKDENYSFDFQYRFDDKKIGTAQVDLFREKKKLDYNSLYNYQSFYYTFDSTMSPPDSFLNIDSVDVNSRSVYNKRSSGISGRFLKQWSSLHFAGGVDWLSGSIRANTNDVTKGTNITGPSASFDYSFGNQQYWYSAQNQFDVWTNVIIETMTPLRIDLSERLQFVKNRKMQPSYNLGFIYSPTASVRFKVGYAYAFRLPTISEQFAEDVFTAGNDNLNAETSRSLMASVNYNTSNGRLSAGATVFHQTVDSLIQYQLDFSSFKYMPVNVEKFKTGGIDITLKYKLSGIISFSWGGVIQKAQQTKNGGEDYIDAFYVPDFKWRFDFSGEYDKLYYNLNTNYTSARSITQGNSERKIYEAYEIGMTIGFAFLRNFTLNMTGYDLLNEKRADQFGFSANDNDYPSPGRRFILGAAYRL